MGTTDAQRQALAKRFDCHPTWLNDDSTRREAPLASFWIDRHPVTNAEYLAYVEAVGWVNAAVFAWGDAWPGPIDLRRENRISWDLPGTRPVGGGRCGRSADGVKDFAGQVLQWAADVRPHHGVQFQLMKGASWFHEDPVNFRTASGWWAYEGWSSRP